MLVKRRKVIRREEEVISKRMIGWLQWRVGTLFMWMTIAKIKTATETKWQVELKVNQESEDEKKPTLDTLHRNSLLTRKELLALFSKGFYEVPNPKEGEPAILVEISAKTRRAVKEFLALPKKRGSKPKKKLRKKKRK